VVATLRDTDTCVKLDGECLFAERKLFRLAGGALVVMSIQAS
jgi:hypothetical protein